MLPVLQIITLFRQQRTNKEMKKASSFGFILQ